LPQPEEYWCSLAAEQGKEMDRFFPEFAEFSTFDL
jgi:hypothetical protein